ncbi:hypothetical protein [Zhihengliuella salsuginis]|uniref:MinD-like ATPase involved in chromosome partitioning or flagellar assembly n=1 Tax=Zhihengliuella salsuginis TaxID=578222 RepID=A0ABQ3GL34_9MICC|nr:hypothetical protein [Zhihengliuella salsuginis]GHD10178.1 hypothetical protein GCM10008096_23480 [Zhihengliuella salsuginis]
MSTNDSRSTPEPAQEARVVDPWAPAPGRGARRDRDTGRRGAAPSRPAPSPGGRVDPAVGQALSFDLLRLSHVSGASGGFARTLRRIFGSDQSAAELAASAAEAQAPVSTGRRIAVFSTRGGAGTTTAAALLARLYAAVRQDTVAALDLAIGHGTLGLRLGVDDRAGSGGAATFAHLVPETTGGRLPSAEDMRSMLAPVRDNLLATASAPAADGPPPAGSLVRETCASVSRYFPLTVLDCPAGVNQPTTAAALADAHAVVWVVPATMSGIEDALAQLSGPYLRQLVAAGRVVVVVTQLDRGAPLSAAAQAARLTALGYEAHALDYDAHLAAGARLGLARLGPQRRMGVAHLAGRVLTVANAAQAPLGTSSAGGRR